MECTRIYIADIEWQGSSKVKREKKAIPVECYRYSSRIKMQGCGGVHDTCAHVHMKMYVHDVCILCVHSKMYLRHLLLLLITCPFITLCLCVPGVHECTHCVLVLVLVLVQ